MSKAPRRKPKKKYKFRTPTHKVAPVRIIRLDGTDVSVSAKRVGDFLRASPATQTHRSSYLAYIRSPEWRSRREWIMARDDGFCPCGAKAEHVHHKTYERLGNELPSDLVAVCEPCHVRIHQLVRLNHSLDVATQLVLGQT